MVCLDYLGTYVSAMAQIKFDKKSRPHSSREDRSCAGYGPVINPEGARMQIEGGHYHGNCVGSY